MSKRRKPMYQTRSARSRRQALLKAGVWIFLVLFIVSIVGVAVIVVQSTTR
ncbi:MAG: hypothetical protein JOZ97_02235 [Candidatus Eremiobacteraeota bacterium]|nr:hypothetical protein [Candidatus Eremiobacteraeota bacterium]